MSRVVVRSRGPSKLGQMQDIFSRLGRSRNRAAAVALALLVVSGVLLMHAIGSSETHGRMDMPSSSMRIDEAAARMQALDETSDTRPNATQVCLATALAVLAIVLLSHVRTTISQCLRRSRAFAAVVIPAPTLGRLCIQRR
jgi:hypothetical protein